MQELSVGSPEQILRAFMSPQPWVKLRCMVLSKEPRRAIGLSEAQDFSVHRSKETIMAMQQYESCIEACNSCAEACDFCAASCLLELDVYALARCMALDLDCAVICRMAAAF